MYYFYMKSLKEILIDSNTQTMESLFDDDLVEKDVDEPIHSFDDIQKIILDPIANSLGVNIFYKTDNNLFKIITTKPKKFINIIKSQTSLTSPVYFISACYKLTQEKKQKYNKDIIRIVIQIRQEILESNEMPIFKLCTLLIIDGKNSSFDDGRALDGTYKTPKILKNIFNSDPNKYTVIRDDFWGPETVDVTGVITAKNYKDIKNYFTDLFEKFFELMDKYDNSNMGEFMLTHKLKSMLK